MNEVNFLTINNRGKSIPYGGGTHDEGVNHGFKLLKGLPDRLLEIPELEADPALRELVRAINEPQTGILSVGCVSGAMSDENGHRVSGYVEFAFDSTELVADAMNYFKLFFWWDHELHGCGFQESFRFNWELEGANFRPSGAAGFSAAIFLNTGYHQSLEGARDTWQRALGALTSFLGSVPRGPGGPLFLEAPGFLS